MVKLVKELQTEKTEVPKMTTESGISRLMRELQPLNASSPMQFTEPKVRLVSELQSLKALNSILVTEAGIVRLVSELQPLKVS